jgi:hypothetical protein
LDNDFVGTHFLANEDYNFDLIDYLSDNLIWNKYIHIFKFTEGEWHGRQ